MVPSRRLLWRTHIATTTTKAKMPTTIVAITSFIQSGRNFPNATKSNASGTVQGSILTTGLAGFVTGVLSQRTNIPATLFPDGEEVPSGKGIDHQAGASASTASGLFAE
jgi:hypothetical protein